MPAVARAFTECIMKRCRYLKLFAYIMCLCSGLVVAVLGYASLTRLNVLSVESQRWGLYEHQRHLAALAVATVVLGSACALAAVLGCVDALLARRPHLALDVVAGVLILAQVGVASAGFTLMIWVKNDIPPGRTNCKGCLKNVIFVCGRLIPAIGSLLLTSTVAQCVAIVVNRVDQSQAEVQAKLDRANNLEEYRMKTMDDLIGSWAPRKTQSWGGNLDYSGSMFDSSMAAARKVETAATTTPRMKLRFGAAKPPPARIRPPIEIVITEAPPDASSRAASGAAFKRDTQGEGGTLSLPDFSHYANVE
ncbi:hypothetical protein HPB50_014419 [Hyalomma asiaticum]|uniref:Uncharacterized protein n=1 Tax=Hyalomma asiaticum TaxID=266040 RepID=A0ACB7SMS1_HYAAI|nr:hypothetical protein HPB50_014419 [Hyalomma asiaticum]